MRNRDYTVDELVHNQSFQRMVQGTASPDDINKWSNWIEKSDQNRHKVKSAISVIVGFELDDPSRPDIEKEWSRFYESTIGKQNIPYLSAAEKGSALRWIYRIAVALLLISIVGVGSYLYSEHYETSTQLKKIIQKKTIVTEDGEKKSLTFSNGAKVILNSNSTLTYTLGLLNGGTIQVSLQGEAYFDADSKMSKDQPAFSVITPAGVIEDIGTQFLVTVEKERSRIVLQEGRVKVEAANGKKLQKELHVTKGEMVEFIKSSVLKKATVNPTFYTSWATGSMTFDQSKIREFAEYIEKKFDVEVQIVDPDLTGIKIDGAVYFKSLEGLMRSVSDVIEIPVYQSEDRNTVYIGNRE